MSYQALLFCPDEKTARVVSQVLSELDFHVEPCNEPFAAVKKLMAQHFDAIVVDCDNEQNAALLFKSARNSGTNQASLAVAVVEGQAGVAKAFRIGANLVLTKPIHVEQSKGTLRVARGLLRKGQAGKPPGVSAPSAESVVSQPSFSTSSLSAPTISVPFAAARSTTPPPAGSASAFELDAEPAPQPDAAEATLLEYMPDSAPSGTENLPQSAADTGQSKQYPWRPGSKPQAEPMASALRRAAEAVGKSEIGVPAPSLSSAPQPNNGAAAAPARAKEISLPSAAAIDLKPAIATIPTHLRPETNKSKESGVAEAWGSNSASPATEELQFASLSGNQQTSDAGTSKKILVAAVVVLAAAAIGYVGWNKTHTVQPQPVAQSIVSAPANPAATLPPEPVPSITVSQSGPGESTVEQSSNSLSGTAPSSSKPSAAVLAEIPGTKTPLAAKLPIPENDVTVVKMPTGGNTEQPQALLVKNDHPKGAKPEAEAPESEEAPSASSIATGTSNSALTSLVNTNAVNAQKAPQQTLRISQGVSQGLILKKVQPTYPPQALQMRLEGRVELQANVSKTGNISGIKQLSGDAILGRAAMEAVRQWKYKPYYLNGEPIEIQTQISVNFKLP